MWVAFDVTAVVERFCHGVTLYFRDYNAHTVEEKGG